MASSTQANAHSARFAQSTMRADKAIVKSVIDNDPGALYLIKNCMVSHNLWPDEAVTLVKGPKRSSSHDLVAELGVRH